MKKNIRLIVLCAMLLVLCGAWFVGAQNKTAFFSHRQAGGGIVIQNETYTTGNIWFVDSGSGAAADQAGCGQSPSWPCATIDYAYSLATANNGDEVWVMPGHAENISTASGIDLDTAGIRVIGLGIGRTRPVLTWTAAAGYIEVNAANISMENMVLDLSTAGIATTGVSLFTNATDFLFKDMEVILFEEASGSATAALNLWSGGTRTQIDGCNFHGFSSTSSGVSSVIAIPANALDGIYIVDTLINAYTSSPLINGNASAVSRFYIARSDLHQQKNTAQNMDMTSSDGIMKDVTTSFATTGVTLTTSALSKANIF